MPMRFLKLALLAAMLAAMPLGAARADPAYSLVIMDDFSAEVDERDMTAAARARIARARTHLLNRLNSFRRDVEDAAGRPLFGVFRLSQIRGVGRAAPGRWKHNTIAILWGNIEDQQPDLKPLATIYLGPYRVETRERRQVNRFATVLARIRPNAVEGDFRLYEIIIGYALLNRAWEENREMVPPIVSVLQSRIRLERGGLNRNSQCLDRLSDAVDAIRRRVARGDDPNPSGTRANPPDELDCDPIN